MKKFFRIFTGLFFMIFGLWLFSTPFLILFLRHSDKIPEFLKGLLILSYDMGAGIFWIFWTHINFQKYTEWFASVDWEYIRNLSNLNGAFIIGIFQGSVLFIFGYFYSINDKFAEWFHSLTIKMNMNQVSVRFLQPVGSLETQQKKKNYKGLSFFVLLCLVALLIYWYILYKQGRLPF